MSRSFFRFRYKPFCIFCIWGLVGLLIIITIPPQAISLYGDRTEDTCDQNLGTSGNAIILSSNSDYQCTENGPCLGLNSDYNGDPLCEPADPVNDADGDGICGDMDNCPDVFNPEQMDTDKDGKGDVCDPDPQRADVYLFMIGPLYALIFEPYRYLFFAEYDSGLRVGSVMDLLILDANNRMPDDPFYNPGDLSSLFITDPNGPNGIKQYWLGLGADPNYGLWDSNCPHFGGPDPVISGLMGHDFIVDPGLPIFRNPDWRLGPDGIINPAFQPESTGDNKTLRWNTYIQGYGAIGVCCGPLVNPLPVDPYDGMPTYIPVHRRVVDVIARYGKPFFAPSLVYNLECALWNTGFTHWPNITYLDFLPQYFEDFIITLEVSDGFTSDARTFPISVISHPTENYPPLIEEVNNKIFYIGHPNTYAVSVVDRDCMIFSLSLPAYLSHRPATSGDFRTDMDSIDFDLTLNGISVQHYAQWMDIQFDSMSGLFRFTPPHEAIYDMVLTATDEHGGTGYAEFRIICSSIQRDMDGDGILDDNDNCPYFSNPIQEDIDGDGIGNGCDAYPDDPNNYDDADGDGVLGVEDNCPWFANADQTDGDSDGKGDECDNCPGIFNTDQSDKDHDWVGDACDPCPNDMTNDSDKDDICGNIDNCPNISNPDQMDKDKDGLGNVCDNCPEIFNPEQSDKDGDNIGDPCDNCPDLSNPFQDDTDADGVGNACDNCPYISNDNQKDSDGDGMGDECDNCPEGANNDQNDTDADGVGNACDNCPYIYNDNQKDSDGDGKGDECDNCLVVANSDQTDTDGDGIGDVCDNCQYAFNPAQVDEDSDNIGDECDVCPKDSVNDKDGDNICGMIDNCPGLSNPDQTDKDNDGIGDVCDNCPNVPNPDQTDKDDDGLGNVCDNCLISSNPKQVDNDKDSIGDLCDNCPDLSNPFQDDIDEDRVGDVCDNCQYISNYKQRDADNDGIGDECDNCPVVANPDQTDSDEDHIGDACDSPGTGPGFKQTKVFPFNYLFWSQIQNPAVLPFPGWPLLPGYQHGTLYGQSFYGTQILPIYPTRNVLETNNFQDPQQGLRSDLFFQTLYSIKPLNHQFFLFPSFWIPSATQSWHSFSLDFPSQFPWMTNGYKFPEVSNPFIQLYTNP